MTFFVQWKLGSQWIAKDIPFTFADDAIQFAREKKIKTCGLEHRVVNNKGIAVWSTAPPNTTAF